MKMNTNNSEPVIINNQHIEEVDEFTYLGSKVSTDGDSGKDVQARLAKANQAFGSLNAVWKSKQLRVKTKIRIFKSNVLSVLLYGSECWKMTKEICKKLDIPNEVATAHQENFLARENQKRRPTQEL